MAMATASALRIPLAKRGTLWFTAWEARKGGAAFTCGCCNEKVVLKKGTKRAHHFAHAADTQCELARGDAKTCESMQHRYAKHILSTTLSLWKFTCKCLTCVAPLVLQWETSDTVGVEEEWRCMGGKFVLDVAVIRAGEAIAALEVLHTHAIGEKKRGQLERAGLAVVEVSAADVIKAYEDRTFTASDVGDTHSLVQCGSCKSLPRKRAVRTLLCLLQESSQVATTFDVHCTAGHHFQWRVMETLVPQVSKSGLSVRVCNGVKIYVSNQPVLEPGNPWWWAGPKAILNPQRNDASVAIRVCTRPQACRTCKWAVEEERRRNADVTAMRDEDPMYAPCESGAAHCALAFGAHTLRIRTQVDMWNGPQSPRCACFTRYWTRYHDEQIRRRAAKKREEEEEKQRVVQEQLERHAREAACREEAEERERQERVYAAEARKARDRVAFDAKERGKRKKKEKEEAERKRRSLDRSRQDLRGKIKSVINNWLSAYPFTFSEENLPCSQDAVYEGRLHLKPHSPHSPADVATGVEDFLNMLNAFTLTNTLPPPHNVADGDSILRFRIVCMEP
jgi:hypothetical protein